MRAHRRPLHLIKPHIVPPYKQATSPPFSHRSFGKSNPLQEKTASTGVPQYPCKRQPQARPTTISHQQHPPHPSHRPTTPLAPPRSHLHHNPPAASHLLNQFPPHLEAAPRLPAATTHPRLISKSGTLALAAHSASAGLAHRRPPPSAQQCRSKLKNPSTASSNPRSVLTGVPRGLQRINTRI